MNAAAVENPPGGVNRYCVRTKQSMPRRLS